MTTAEPLFLLLLCWGHSYAYSSMLRETPEEPAAHWTPPGCVRVGSEGLACRGLNFSSVPARLDPRLRRLDVSNNQIRDLALPSLGSLQELDASHNGMRSVREGAFQSLVGLRTLNLGGNVLKDDAARSSAAFRALPELRSLDLSSNGLDHLATALYLTVIPALRYLSLKGNALAKLSPGLFAGSPDLEGINIENNLVLDVEDGTFEPLSRLTWLNMASNNLACICDFKLHGLRFLNLSRNSIEFFITRQGDDAYQLETLDLSYNSLLYFPVLPKRNYLKNLHLQNNNLGDMVPERSFLEASSLYEEITDSDAFGPDGDSNIYSDWMLMLLSHLDLSNNQFTSFPLKTLHYLPSLESLNMSSNCLLDFGHDVAKSTQSQSGPSRSGPLPSLRTLDLQHNQIRSLGFAAALPKIEKLNLHRNLVKPCAGDQSEPMGLNGTDGVHCVSFRGIATLKHLDLRENGIKMLFPQTFQHTPLVSLDLAGNKAMAMSGEALAGLQSTLESLSLGGNRMRGSDLPLPCLGALRRLVLAGNQLEVLPDAVGCSPLRELDLQSNGFASLDGRLLTGPSSRLETAFITGNAFNCCAAGWLEILLESGVHVPDLDRATCLYGLNGSMSTQSLGNHSSLCPPKANLEPAGSKLLILMVIVLIVALSLVIVLLLVKGATHGKCTSLDLKGNKVASIEYCNDEHAGAQVAKINIYETALN
ncbi:hypothetical protein AAFF_G00046210 [Aldrovandia affinis]|uniref:Leucine-rich repeat-containing protein 32 n=1 Tax=Aldrovandia affinis TaxID=143900 RepID=A0AAD7WF79_9TELE|nr:hypothetical protein AAFF_G00046210 [Aldrovandia affinis]